MIKQIIYIVVFIFWILSYSYSILTPSLLLGLTNNLNLVKQLSQTLISNILINGFNYDILINTKNDINLMNSNPDLIDILICNHVSSMDFLIILTFLQSININNFNFVLKKEIEYIPGFGLIMYANSDIKLNRDWNLDKINLEKQVDNIINNNINKKQVILIFPEGTRLTTKKLLDGQQYSMKNNLNIFNNLLVPKSKGLWFLINALKNKNKLGNIWDITIAIPNILNKTSKSNGIIEGIKYKNIYLNITLINLLEEYKNQDKIKEWLLNLWINKDNYLDNYKENVYKKLEINDFKFNDLALITLICIMFIFLFNDNGKYYLLSSFILSYILILLKL